MSEGATLLLGCGSLGLAVARRLGQDRAFRRIITADLDAHRAAAVAETCGERAVDLRLDYRDDGSLSRVLEDVDLVVNTIMLPLPETLALMRTVLESGVSYADACADSETLQAIFDSDYLDALAGFRAVAAVPGLGASPGLTNALTSYLGQRLERIDEARFYLADDLSLRSERQWRERLADFGSVALVWQDSDWRQLDPMSDCAAIPFPPLGEVYSSTVGIGPVTLPGSFGSLAHVSSHRGFKDAGVFETIRTLVACGLAGQDTVETSIGAISPAEFASAFFSQPRNDWGAGRGSGASFWTEEPPKARVRQAQVAGMLRGMKTRFTMTYRFPDESDIENQAATLAIGARMLLTREMPAPGLHAPESLDPAPFLWDMERRGVEIQLAKTIED